MSLFEGDIDTRYKCRMQMVQTSRIEAIHNRKEVGECKDGSLFVDLYCALTYQRQESQAISRRELCRESVCPNSKSRVKIQRLISRKSLYPPTLYLPINPNRGSIKRRRSVVIRVYTPSRNP